MVAAIPPNSGASAWENDQCEQCGNVDVSDSDALCPLCGGPLLRPVIEQGGTYRLIKGFHSSSYKRMRPDEPSCTITTASGHIGSHNTIHPFENRVLSPLECANIQSFPHDFNWGDSLERWGHTNIRAMIGEAVPPAFTRLHGIVLSGILTDTWSIAPISLDDERCTAPLHRLDLADRDLTPSVTA